ncbi:ABC transporter ATP-binding protein [Thermosipho melanesiensis]|uniref:ABC transporter related n=2 Tax=Thermosipho melanesiensis TaxID=46541 RepID=A6LJA0_THEM4|nr:ABC transporter ATP-binding protein [Thermosipho melanesiensis]ABR30001.1 ABC transporter related [Thermosipho melanesiensis BI429]APT73205.1 multidrug ABC transporter ATPase [Thermosipho melanesiensis]
MIREFLKRRIWFYFAGVITLIVVDTLQLIVPKFISRAVDSLNVETPDIGVAKLMAIGIIGIAIGMFFTRFFWRFFIIGSARKFTYEARKILYDKILSLDMSFFDKNRSGDLMANFTNDMNNIERMLGPGIVMMVDASFMSVITLFFMATSVGWKLTLIALIPLPFIMLISLVFGKFIYKRSKKVQDTFSDLSGFTEESIDGIRILKSFSILPKFENLFLDRANRNFRATLSLVKVWGIMWPLIHFISSLSYFITIAYGGPMVINQKITLGMFFAFNNYIGMIVWPLTAFGWVINIIQNGRASYTRILEVLKTQSKVVEPDNPVEIDEINDITIKNLNYKYPDSNRYVLKGVNLEIKRGQLVGIVGTVGSGKSTIVKIISKLYPVERGYVYINGYDINDIPSKIVRTKISYVPQETFLFSTSIKNNIAFGLDDFEEWQIKEYAMLSAVHSDIERFPKSYDTVVGERGVTLSGGQKQRITIARALIRNCDVFIFDDCLSAVDPETEEKIISSLRKSMESKTMIIITHRLKVLKDADIIYVFDDGQVVESGTHKQLMEIDGLYADMYKKQLIEESL